MDTVQLLRAELRHRRGRWREICASTGLSYWWLIKFAQGRIGEPGLSKVELLQAFIRNDAGTQPPIATTHTTTAEAP